MAYTTYTLVRLMTNLSTNDISDANITSIITSFVTPEINSQIMVYEEEEVIFPILGDSEKNNKIDSSNTAYYLKNYPLGDLDDDGDADASDLTVVQVDSTTSPPTRTTLTVSTVNDVKRGKFTLSSAPSNGMKLLVSYKWCPLGININTPDLQLQNAATYLAAAYCFAKVDPLLLRQMSAVDIVPMGKTANEYRLEYQKIMIKIKSDMLTRVKTMNKLPQFAGLTSEAASSEPQSLL